MAVYAPIDRENFPHETELRVTEMQGLERKLRQYNANYQVGMERRVMWDLDEAEYRYIVLKWEPQYLNKQWQHEMGKQRTVLLETTDPDQVIATLKMLLSIEREPK
jgi:hypothetical protein